MKQEPKALSPMLVTPLGKSILVIEEQRRNASLPIEVTLAGIVTLTRDVQLLNALSLMVVTPASIVTSVNAVQSENAPLPRVTLLGMVTFLMLERANALFIRI